MNLEQTQNEQNKIQKKKRNTNAKWRVSMRIFKTSVEKNFNIFFLLLLPNERLCQVLCNRQNLIFDILFI